MFFYWKWWIFYVDFKNAIKVRENIFGFEDNCLGTCCGNFSLLWQEYKWSPVNVLKDGPNISHPTKRVTQNSLCLILMERWHENAAVESSAVFVTPYQVNFQRVFWNRSFRAFKEPHSSESITLEIWKLWRFLFSKSSKFHIRLRDMIQNSICLMLLESSHKIAAVQTWAVFETT